MAMLGEDAKNLNDVLQPILYSISQLVACDAVCIHIFDETRAELVLMAQYGMPLIDVNMLEEIKVSPDIVRWMEKAVSDEISNRYDKNPVFYNGLRVDSYKTYLANPIGNGQKILGFLSCYRIADQYFSSFESMFINSLGDLLGIIIENYRLRLEAKELATVDERQRLAREIHDAISQSVYSLSLFARSASDALSENNQSKLKENLEDIEEIALQAMREMRLLIYQLREELRDEDFVYALDIRYQQVETRLGINASHDIDANILLPENVHHHMWRIIIEALNNSVKYALANQVSVKISQMGSNVILVIEDDGVGFDVSENSPGMGLKNIGTRTKNMNGEFEIISQPGQGTRIRIKIPIGKDS
jgi:signal transduction histidine kinase